MSTSGIPFFKKLFLHDAAGEKEITRRLSFKPYCSRGSYALARSVRDSKFEDNLCKNIIHNFPEIESEPGDDATQKVQKYLEDRPDRFEKVLVQVHRYIKREKITHYVSGIDLGAAVYSVSTSKEKLRKKALKGEAGVEYLAGLGAGAEAKKEKKHRQKQRHTIGKMDQLKRGTGEAVIGYSILPLFTLVCDEHREVKRVLQQAIKFYLDRSRKTSCLRT